VNNNELPTRLVKACDSEKNALKNMFQLYLHDLSAYTTNLNINADGIFENNDIDTYYEKDTLIPMVIQHNNMISGFILLNTPPYASQGYNYYINDFFVLRKFRGKGVGNTAAEELFRAYPGKYAMVQLIKNDVAINFWKRVLNENGFEFEEKEVIIDGDACIFHGLLV